MTWHEGNTAAVPQIHVDHALRVAGSQVEDVHVLPVGDHDVVQQSGHARLQLGATEARAVRDRQVQVHLRLRRIGVDEGGRKPPVPQKHAFRVDFLHVFIVGSTRQKRERTSRHIDDPTLAVIVILCNQGALIIKRPENLRSPANGSGELEHPIQSVRLQRRLGPQRPARCARPSWGFLQYHPQVTRMWGELQLPYIRALEIVGLGVAIKPGNGDDRLHAAHQQMASENTALARLDRVVR